MAASNEDIARAHPAGEYLDLRSGDSDSAQVHYLDRETSNPLTQLGVLSTVNILIGANNSGKSRLMRSLAARATNVLVDGRAPGVLRSWAQQLQEAAPNLPEQAILWVGSIGEWPVFPLKELVPDFAQKLELLAKAIELLPSVLVHLPVRQAEVWLQDTQPRRNASPQFAEFLHTSMQAIKGIHFDPPEPTAFSDLLASPVWMFLEAGRSKTVRIYQKAAEKYIKDIRGVPALYISELASLCRVQKPKRVYLPILRTAHSIYTAGDTRLGPLAYEHTVRTLYEVAPEIEVFTGLELYEQFLRERSGKKALRTRFAEFEGFLSRHFFGNRPIDIVPEFTSETGGQHIRVDIGDSIDHRLHNLGDGVNALILLVYRVFMADAETWFFIEEPETHLHPGLQRMFLEALLHEPAIRAKRLRFFLTTHSNHLLELAMSEPHLVSVFSLAKYDGTDRFAVGRSQGPDLQVLDRLGVHNASVFLANCSIWVEGPSDRHYLRAYLDAYLRARPQQRPLREDIEFAFFEYAGSNLAHYVFTDEAKDTDISKIRAQFIANRVFLLADLDRGKDSKHDALREQGEPKKFLYATTDPGIEIENLLSVEILQVVAPRLFESPAARDALRDTLLVFDAATLPTRRLGSYLDDALRPLLGANTPQLFKRPKVARTPAAAPPTDQTLTDYYKDKLSQKVLEMVHDGTISWEMLSDPAKALTERIVAFINASAR